ncbi:MAG: hypothetical protein HOO91_10670 [Bacteroidales bacterium]|nr:hypothetical protein [Bacteroidales bacterium]
MELIEIKKKVYDKCVEKQKEILENAKAAMDDAQKAANEYGPPRDRYDSFRAQLLRKRDLHAEQYEKAIKEMDFLLNLKPENQNKELIINTLVVTNKQKFYVSIGLGKITVPEGEFYAISPQAPIYQSLKEKIKGDSVVFNGQKITILELV